MPKDNEPASAVVGRSISPKDLKIQALSTSQLTLRLKPGSPPTPPLLNLEQIAVRRAAAALISPACQE